jgi:modulator of FtsH protease HflK
LYLDAQEQIMSSTSKVLVDQKGGNSLLYLPLDKLMAVSGASAPNGAVAASASNTRENEVVQDDTRELTRDRDGR